MTKPEIIQCSFDDFQKHYLPFIPDDKVVHHVCDALKKIPDAKFNNTSKESTHFDPIDEICSQILKMEDSWDWDKQERERNDLIYYTLSKETHIDSDMEGCTHQIDAYLTNDRSEKVKLNKVHAVDIIVPFEFKTGGTKNELHKNQLQVIEATFHTMNDDPRRQFIFAITVEGNRMSVCYISHSHCAKSQSVDINEEPDKFISLMISLYYSTYKELGFDPNVFWVKEEDAFIYKVNEKWYKVAASIIDHRRNCLTGHSTRVFMIEEVKSLDDLNPVDNKEKVLKDVWLDAGACSERQIQLALFEDIDKFSADPNWKQDPCLKHLSQISESIEELDHLFQDKHYKNLFLLIADEFAGVISKSIPEQSYHPLNLLPNSNSTPNVSVDPDSQWTSSVPVTRDDPQLKAITKGKAKRYYAPKRRYFMIFDDVCKTVDALPTIGDAFQVLAGCATALRLMYCAGWVHRDISTGNIMAVRGDGDKWNVKLADLEFAKKFPDDEEGSHEPKTGTPFFMPYEILLGGYYALDFGTNCFEAGHISIKKDKKIFLHNYQHDLESLFWVLLWLITCRVNHDISANWAASAFQVDTLHSGRILMFMYTISEHLAEKLHPDMKDSSLPKYVNGVRGQLVNCMVTRSEMGDWMDPKSYSTIHHMFFLAFQLLNNPNEPWATIPLKKRVSPSVHFTRPQHSQVRHMKRKATDTGDSNPEVEKNDGDEPVSPTNAPVRGKVSRKRSKVAP